jgi:hypothetical protein
MMNLDATPSKLDLPDPNDPAACSAWLQTRYMKSDRDADFRDALMEVLETDSQGNFTAMPLRVGLPRDTRGLMVLGPSGSGKNSMVTRNLLKIEAIGLTTGVEDGPGAALYQLVDSDATMKSFAIGIANATGYPKVKDNIRTTDAWDLAIHRLALSEKTILWIDEPHHLLTPGPGRDPKAVLRRLKGLMQGPKAVALILTGVPELYEMTLTDNETDRRFIFMNLRSVRGKSEVTKLGNYLDLCCEKVGIMPIDDDSFLDRLLMANNRNLGRSIEMTMKAIRRAHRRPERKLSLKDFRRCLELESNRIGVGPFEDMDWAGLRPELEKHGWVP